MKKNKTFTIKTILSFAAATLFLACSNVGGGYVANGAGGQKGSDKGGVQAPVMVTVNGSLDFGGAYPAQIAALVENSCADGLDGIARSAFPDAASSGLTYSVYALEELPSGSTDTPLRYEGTVAVDKKSYTVGIPVLTGKKYNVFAEVKNGGITVLSGQSDKVIEAPSGESSFVTDANITLAATQTSGKKGCVQLAVNVQDTGISSARAVYTDPSDGSQKTIDGESGDGGNTLTFSVGINDEGEPEPENGLASGAYLVTFNFYSEAGSLLYSFTEAVNVFDGMTTNKWVKNGGEPWLTPDSSGNIACKITAAMVTGFGLTDIYVDPTNGSDANSGVFWAPKKTLSGNGVNPGALSMLQDANADYTIHIKGTVEGGQTIPSTIRARSLTLCGETGLDEGVPQDKIDVYDPDDPDSAYGKSALLIETAVPITIKNLKITGGMGAVDGEYAYGGGICLKAEGGSLTLASGAYVSENKAKAASVTNKGRGAGICLYPACSLNILDGAVIENNESDGAGGGIFCKSTSVITMSGGHIRGNTAVLSGGALNMGYGTFTMTGGVIGDVSESISQAAKYGDDARLSAYSNAAKQGGAIFSSGTGSGNLDIYLLGGTIAYNCAQDNGGAIYLGGCNMTVKNAKIQYNGAGGTPGGGAFCFGNDADLHLEDCSIIGNECYGEGALGGAICVLGPSTTGGTSKIYLKGSVSIPSDGARTNDIVLKKYSSTGAGYWIHPALTIEGKLTGSGKIARLTPTSDDYNVNRVVLKLASGVTDTSLANEAYKFDVTPQESQAWMVGSDGKLKMATVLTNANINSFIDDTSKPSAMEYHFVIGSDVNTNQLRGFLNRLFTSSNEISSTSTLDLSQVNNLTGADWTALNDITKPQAFDTVIIGSSFAGYWAGLPQVHKSFSKVRNLVAPSSNRDFVSEDGVLFNKNKTKLIFAPGVKDSPTSYTIPSTVTEIGTYAFAYSSAYTIITIPDSVTKIQAYGLNVNTSTLDFRNPNDWHIGSATGTAIASDNLSIINAATYYKESLKSNVLVRVSE